MRTFLNISLDILTSLFFAASIGVGAGVAAVSFTHRLGNGLRVAAVSFLAAFASFGYAIWRSYRPLERVPVHAARPMSASAP